MGIQVRKSKERGFFNYSWLKTHHTFSFAEYVNPNAMNFRALRVLNENWVSPGVGFPVQAQSEMEIFSIVINGGLAHQDDRGHGSILRPGQIQLLSTGSGMTHSEFNASDREDVHFLQIWMTPHTRKLKPSYQEKHFNPTTQHNQWGLIISPDGKEGALHIHQDAFVYLAHLDEGKTLNYELNDQRYGWLQVIEGEILLNNEYLEAGDGATLSHLFSVQINAQSKAHLLFIDLS